MPGDNIQIDSPKGYSYRAESKAPKLEAPFEVKNLTETSADVWLTGEVGWDIYAPYVIEQLKAIDGEGKTIRIFVNSPGGDVFQGYSIANFIASMKATVIVEVNALAASIASLIAVSADRVEMPENSMMMIHNAWAWAVGEADELRNTATLLDKMNGQLAAAYTGKRLRALGETDGGEDFVSLMSETSWLTADEAMSLGLCDAVISPVRAAAVMREDYAARIRVPENILAALAVEDETPPAPTEEELAAQASAEEEARAAAEAEAAAAAQAEADAAAAQAALEAEANAAAEAAQAAEDEAAITAVCRAFEAADRAPEFIAAKASLVDVRKALWKAAAARDAQIQTDPTPPAAQIPEGDAYAKRADEARKNYASALTR